jgi:aminoglycoside phosphotransferase (APT) family kinase protein
MKPWMLFRAARQFAELHAAMHRCVRPQLPSQRDQMQRFILQAPGLAADSKERVLEALERLPDGNVVCHGDYHPDNILMSSRGPIIIDWMSATRGNPLADVARTSLMFRMASLPPGMSTYRRWLFQAARRLFHAVYLREYFKLQPFSHEEWQAWFLPLAAARLNERIPQEEQRLIDLVEASLNGEGGR